MRMSGSTFLFVALALALCPIAFAQSLDEVSTINQRVAQLYQQGKFSEAVPLAKRLLAIRENAFGPNHPDVAISLNDLGMLSKHQGLYAEAEPPYKRALYIREQAFGPNNAAVAESLNNLGTLYYNQGRYAEAEPLLKRSLDIRGLHPVPKTPS